MQKAVPTDIVFFNPELQLHPGRLRIHVLFTNPADTLAALQTAIAMASDLESEIALIVTQIVPFPLPLDNPPVRLDIAGNQIRRLAESVDLGAVEVQGCIYLCRNPLETLIRKLPAHSLVVVGIRPRWPFGKLERLVRALRRNGHAVILTSHH
jgi:hypothetical protein